MADLYDELGDPIIQEEPPHQPAVTIEVPAPPGDEDDTSVPPPTAIRQKRYDSSILMDSTPQESLQSIRDRRKLILKIARRQTFYPNIARDMRIPTYGELESYSTEEVRELLADFQQAIDCGQIMDGPFTVAAAIASLIEESAIKLDFDLAGFSDSLTNDPMYKQAMINLVLENEDSVAMPPLVMLAIATMRNIKAVYKTNQEKKILQNVADFGQMDRDIGATLGT